MAGFIRADVGFRSFENVIELFEKLIGFFGLIGRIADRFIHRRRHAAALR